MRIVFGWALIAIVALYAPACAALKVKLRYDGWGDDLFDDSVYDNHDINVQEQWTSGATSTLTGARTKEEQEEHDKLMEGTPNFGSLLDGVYKNVKNQAVGKTCVF